jgi:hypothetical protein
MTRKTTKLNLAERKVAVRSYMKAAIKDFHKQKRLNEYMYSHDQFTSTLVEPFADIFKVAKVGAKDLLTTAIFGLDVLTTIDPLKSKKLRDNYKARREAINKERSKLLKPFHDVFAGDDAQALMFVMAPGLYAATKFPKLFTAKDQSISDYFKEIGLGKKPSEKEKEESGGKIKEPKGIIGSSINALKKLFFAEAIVLSDTDQLLKEQALTSSDAEAALSDVGMLDDLKKLQDEYFDMTQSALAETEEMVAETAKILRGLGAAETPGELRTQLEAASQAGLELGTSPDTVINTINQDAEKLAQTDDFKVSAANQAGKPAEELSSADFLAAAQSAVFAQATSELREQATKMMEEFIKNAMKTAREATGIEDIPPDVIAAMQKSPEGVKYLKLFDDFKTRISQVQAG